MFAETRDATERWKLKYYDSLEELERKEREWTGSQDAFYTSLGKLALSAYGLDGSVDDRLEKLRAAVRARQSGNKIAALVANVHQASVEAQSRRADATPEPDFALTLSSLLDGISLPRALERDARRLRKAIASGKMPPAQILDDTIALLRSASSGDDERGGDATPADSPGLLGRLLQRRSESPDTAAVIALLQRIRFPEELQSRIGAACEQLEAAPELADSVLGDIGNLIESALAGQDAKPAGADDKPPPPHQVLLGLLERLEFPGDLAEGVEAVTGRLEFAIPAGELPEVLGAIAGLIRQVQEQVRRERLSMQAYLHELGERLGALDSHFDLTDAAREASLKSGRELRRSVAEQVDGMHDGLDQAVDIESLKGLVHKHVEAITAHVESFVVVEERHSQSTDEESKRLREEVQLLEAEREKLRAELEVQHQRASRDALTGVANRASLEERIRHEHRRWLRYDEPVTVLFWDIDHFKSINDTFGHAAGDKVLKSIGRLFKLIVRDSDLVARYGGEEFVVVMPSTGAEQGLAAADKLRASLEKTRFHFRNMPVPVTASCGVASFKEGETPEQTLKRADAALYEAKRGGRNRCVAAD